MSRTLRVLAATVVVAGGLAVSGVRGDIITHGAATVTMAFVDIGSAGNAADTHGAGYGSVGYAYRMGTYEVSADQWATVRAVDSGVGNAGVWSGSQPAGGTSWYEAARFCNWLTTGDVASGVYSLSGDTVTSIKDHQTAAATLGVATAYFIPTEDEWYKAAYYSPTGVYYDYPTGSNTEPTAVASGSGDYTAVYDGQEAPADVANSGGLSPFLTMGQGGNVWEWNETEIVSSRGLRGGSFVVLYTSLRAGYRSTLDPADELDVIGFRVASIGVVPEPGSLGLLLLGLAGLATRRKRVSR